MQEIFESINWAIIAPFIVIQVILMTIALIDWAKIERTNGPKWLWLLVICFINTIGPVLYFVIGRREH